MMEMMQGIPTMRVTPGEGRMGSDEPSAWTTKVGRDGTLRTGGGRLGGSKAAAGWERPEGRLVEV